MFHNKMLVSAIASLAALFAGAAHAEFPDRPIEIVVPFSAGGGTDKISRIIAEDMSKTLKQSVLVVNKPGAGTIIGTSHVARGKPDGYTLLMATFANAVNPSLNKDLPYSPDKDFAPVGMVGASPNILVVNSKSPYKTVGDIISFAKANPGKLTYGSYGPGTSAHLTAALFENLAGIKMTHVPYKGAAPALTDLLGERIDMIFSAAGVAPQVNAGKLRAVAVTSGKRSASFPDIPTIAESGVPAYEAESWYGLFAPAGTPVEVVKKLNAALGEALKTDAFKEKIAKPEGLDAAPGEPAELGRYYIKQENLWRKVVQDANITVGG
jgi:tripartite-type tricarboxylate transporter receptor subunit TctC